MSRWPARIPRPASGVALLVGAISLTACGGTMHPRISTQRHARAHPWVAVWGATPAGPDCQPRVRDETVRSLVQSPIRGEALRMRLDNRAGATPLRLTVRVAPAALDGRTTGPARIARLHGKPMIVVPAHGRVLTDPLVMAVEPRRALAVDMFTPDASRARCRLGPVLSYLMHPNGGDAGARRSTRGFDGIRLWTYWLATIEVLHRHNHGAIAAVGDSITAGWRVPAQSRWVGRLARIEAPAGIAVIDAGILGDGVTSGSFGGPPMGVLAREAMNWAGVRTILLEGGVNDLGAGASANAVIHALASTARAAHRIGVSIIGMTLTPYANFPASQRAPESARQAVNRWVRSTSLLDGVVDLDRLLVRGQPGRLEPRFDSGDHTHPNAAGDERIVNAVRQALRAAGATR